MTYIEVLPPMIVSAIGIIAIIIRSHEHARNAIRIRQLEEAAVLLDVHAQAIHRFLNSKSAPIILKRFLISSSDAMGDQEVVLKLAQWIASQPMVPLNPDQSESYKDIASAFLKLKASDATLADDFSLALMTLAAGSVLRWAESAALFEQIGTRLAARPKGDLDLAVAAVNLQTGLTFGLNGRAHVLA